MERLYVKKSKNNSKTSSQKIENKPILLRQEDLGFCDSWAPYWKVSDIYPNVVIVEEWRWTMDDKTAMKAIQPTWKKIMLQIHAGMLVVANLVWTPVVWVIEQIDGTSFLREELRKEPNK